MNFSFPSFSRASTDLPFQQPPQKSLLELVIEAKGQLGLVPQRKAEKRNPTASFSAFSDSDEEGDENCEENGGDPGAAQGTSVLTTRTAWVPSARVLDYFFSEQFLQFFLTLHNLSSSRAASALAPPLLSVRDLHLHPVVEAALCAALLESGSHTQHHQQQQQQYQHRGGRGGRRGGRGGRGVSGWESEGRDTAADAAVAAAFPLWEVAKLEQLKEAVFGDEVGDTAAPLSPSAPSPHSFSGVRDDAPQRVLFRGLQQLALPALLLGDHVLLSGPRGVGKRTAVLLAAAANTLTYGASATIAEQGNSAPDEAEEEEEKKEAAARPSREEEEEEEDDATPTSTAAPKAKENDAVVKSEPADATGSAHVEEGAREAAAETQTGRPPAGDSCKTAAPRALFVVSSYADVVAAARWLERIFGPVAFAPYTFERDSCALRPVLDEAAPPIPAPATLSSGGGGVAPSQMLPPGVGRVASRAAYLTPPVPVAVLPFITDIAMAADGVQADVDPTQASASAVLADIQGGGVLSQSEGPDVSELAALVQGAELPVSLSSAPTAKESEDRKRRCRGSSRSASDDDGSDSDDYSDRGRRRRTSSRHGDHRSSRRSHHSHRSSKREDRHRHYNDDDDSRYSNEDDRVDHRRSSHRSSRHRSSRHRSPSDDDAGSYSHRSSRSHRRYAGEKEERRERDRHHNSRHSSHHHRCPRDKDEKKEEEKMRGTAAETPRSALIPSFEDDAGSTTAALSLDAPALPSDVSSCAVLPSAPLITSSTFPVLPSTAPQVLPSASQPTLPTNPYAWLPAALRQRLPIIVTSYGALQSAMAVVDGVASALPPLEQVRVAVFTHLDKALQPPLKESFRHSWWVSLVNALDIECQFVTTTDRGGAEVMGFLTSTILPDAGERLLHLNQRDASIWAMMNVQLSPVGVEVTAAATATIVADGVPAASSGRQQKQQQRLKISGTDIDAAKLTHLFSLVVEHVMSSCSASEIEVDALTGGGAPRRGGSGRVVIVCSNRREQTLILSQLGELFREHQPEINHSSSNSSNGSLRITDVAEIFRSGGTTALVVTDAQLGDVRVLRELHQCTSVDCIVHFSLPRGVMLQLEKAEVAEVLAQRGRAILGHSRPFSSRRWWRLADRGEGSVGSVFEPVKVSCWVMLTEHNMKGRVGTCVMELLSEVSEA